MIPTIADHWVRVPQDDDPMFGIRCYRPASMLPREEQDGQDFLALREEGAFVRMTHGRVTTGAWSTRANRLTLFDIRTDKVIDEWAFTVEGDRLFIGG